MLDRIHSLADVDHLIAERIVYVKSQEAKNLIKDIPYDESTVNNEPMDSVNDEKDTCLMHESKEDFDFIDDDEVPNEFIEGEVDNYSIQLSIPYVCKIDYQSIDKGETTELQDVPIQVAIEQEIEECIEKVVSEMTLPEMFSTDVKIHTDELKLEMPKINAVEICKMPSETKSEMPILEEPREPKLEMFIIKETGIVQSESKLIQDMVLISDVPTQFHNHAHPMTGQEISLPYRAIAQPMTKWEFSVSNKTTLGRLSPKIHTRKRKILGSKLVRCVFPTKSVRRIIPSNTNSICRPPSKSPDKQNSLDGENQEENITLHESNIWGPSQTS